MQQPLPLNITHIAVRRLFGLYDYDLNQTASGDAAGRVAILYGDNGSGKTTILRTVFHLLAPNDRSGHKTEVAKTPFSMFEVGLSDKTIIRAERAGNDLVGNFTLTIKLYRKRAESFLFSTDERLAVSPKSQSPEERAETARCLSMLAELV